MSDETAHKFTPEHPTPLDTASVGNAAVNGPVVDPAYADVMPDGTAVANQGKGAVELVSGAVVTNQGAVPASITNAAIRPDRHAGRPERQHEGHGQEAVRLRQARSGDAGQQGAGQQEVTADSRS